MLHIGGHEGREILNKRGHERERMLLLVQYERGEMLKIGKA